MHVSNWLLSRKDIKLFFGFDLTPLRAFAFMLFAVIDIFTASSEVSQANPALIAMGIMAVVGAGAAVYGTVKANEAGDEAGDKTPEESALLDDIDDMVTGIDRADVEDAVSQATTPIAASVAAGQQQISQAVLASEGGGGAPSQYAGRAAALQEQLAKEGSGAVAQAALGAQLTEEQKALLREEQKLAARTDAASLSRQRKGQVLSGKLGGAQIMGGLGSSMVGGMSQGMGQAAGQKAFV